MSSAHMLTKPVRRYLMERLDRLYDALSQLGQRLRESIASLVGQHVGDLVRETVQAVLENRLPEAKQRLPSYPEPSYRRTFPDERGDPRYGAPQNPGFWYDDEEDYHPQFTTPKPQPATQPMRLWSLLLAGVQAFGWWIKNQPRRISVRKVLGIGAASIVAGLVLGPFAGILTAVAGSALFLTHLADGMRDAVGVLIHPKTP
jgi:hypothetical protein